MQQTIQHPFLTQNVNESGSTQIMKNYIFLPALQTPTNYFKHIFNATTNQNQTIITLRKTFSDENPTVVYNRNKIIEISNNFQIKLDRDVTDKLMNSPYSQEVSTGIFSCIGNVICFIYDSFFIYNSLKTEIKKRDENIDKLINKLIQIQQNKQYNVDDISSLLFLLYHELNLLDNLIGKYLNGMYERKMIGAILNKYGV